MFGESCIVSFTVALYVVVVKGPRSVVLPEEVREAIHNDDHILHEPRLVRRLLAARQDSCEAEKHFAPRHMQTNSDS